MEHVQHAQTTVAMCISRWECQLSPKPQFQLFSNTDTTEFLKPWKVYQLCFQWPKTLCEDRGSKPTEKTVFKNLHICVDGPQSSMATQHLSVEGCRRRNKDYKKKSGERNQHTARIKRRISKWGERERVKEGKIKQIKDLTERDQRKRRKNWKYSQRESRRLQQGKSEGQNNARKQQIKKADMTYKT